MLNIIEFPSSSGENKDNESTIAIIKVKPLDNPLFKKLSIETWICTQRC